jgi:hypothetical protein
VSDVLTVLKRERKSRPEEPAPDLDSAVEPASESLPSELASLEDTVFRDHHSPDDELPPDGEDSPSVNGNGAGH